MHLELKPTDTERVQVIVTGEVDAANADGLAEAIATAATESDRVEIVASGLDFIDSSGIRAVLRSHGNIAARHGSLTIVDAPSHLLRLLEITGLSSVLLPSGTPRDFDPPA